MRKKLIILLGVSLFVGCSQKGYVEPQATIQPPQTYNTPLKMQTKLNRYWYNTIGSKELPKLIDKALLHSSDILIAQEKIKEAKLNVDLVTSAHFPSVNLSASSTARNTKDSTSIGIGASYDLDIWGKLESQSKLATINTLLNEYALQAVQLELISTLSSNYFSYMALDDTLSILNESKNIANKQLKIMEVKYKNGSISKLDLSRQKMLNLSIETKILSLQKDKKLIRSTIASLVGEMPQNFKLQDESLKNIKLTGVDTQLPSNLLLSRVDIASAKKRLQSAELSVDIANASRFPSFSLNANGSLSSDTLLALIEPQKSLSLVLGGVWSIFDGGYLSHKVEIEKSKSHMEVENYRKVVLNAFKEVEDALSGVEYYLLSSKIEEKKLKEAKNILSLSQSKYKNGAVDLSVVLEAQKTLLESNENQLQVKLNYLNALVNLYKSLGGGFEVEA